MSEHIDAETVCLRCGDPIEHVGGIPDPYWRHQTTQPHAAKPDPQYTREVN